jgi:hypothetical protein
VIYLAGSAAGISSVSGSLTVSAPVTDTHHAGLLAPWIKPRAKFVEYNGQRVYATSSEVRSHGKWVEYNGKRVYLTFPEDEEEELLLLGVI